MNFKPLSILLLLAVLITFSCANEDDYNGPSELKAAKWLLGKWQLEGKEVFEEWETDEKKFSGKSFVLAGNDTMIMEYLSLEIIDDTLFYIPTVLNQNEGKPILFKSDGEASESMNFSNPAHDFPKVIRYHLIGNDTINVSIEGTEDKKNEFLLLRHE